MTSLSEQFSAVRQSHLEAQLDMFHKLTSRALEHTEQLIALNLKTSRASVEQAAGTVQQLLQAGDARDLFALGAHAQDPWQHLFAYSRELMGIATGVRTAAWTGTPAPALPPALLQMPAPFANLMEQMAIATADSASVHGEIVAAAADTGAALAESALDAAVQAVPDATLRAAAQATDDAVEGAAQESAAAAQLGETTELAAETAGEPAAGAASQLDAQPSAQSHPQPGTRPDVQPDAQPDSQPASRPDSQPDSPPAALQPDVTPGAGESSVETPGESTVDAPRETAVEPGGDSVVEQPGGDAVETPAEPIGAAGAPLVQAAAIIDAVAEVPNAKAKPLAKAVSKAIAKSLGAEHPLAATLPPEAGGHIDMPVVTPGELAPPVQQTQGPAPEERRRGTRKK